MTKKKLKIGIVGCGAIGSALAKYVRRHLRTTMVMAAFCDLDAAKALKLRQEIGGGRVMDLEGLIRSCDFVIEAASAKIAADVVRRCLMKGKDVLAMSVGGLLEKSRGLSALALRKNAHVYLPSGAICGLDGIKALALAGVDEITLNTYKPPAALRGADYVVSRGLALEELKTATCIFEGTAEAAVKAFPQNINIVALLSLAAAGLAVPRVKIFAAPGSDKNVHVIEVRSKAARLEIRCENVPSPDNPKTSALAILSAAAALKGIGAAVRVGS